MSRITGKVHLWVWIRYAWEDCRPKLTGIAREVARMLRTINSAGISTVHIQWIWQVHMREGIGSAWGLEEGEEEVERWADVVWRWGYSLQTGTGNARGSEQGG